GETLQIAAGKHELKIWRDVAGRLPHAFQETLKDFIAVEIDEIVSFQDFAGQDYVFENQRAQALFDHGPDCGNHGFEFRRSGYGWHLCEGDDPFGEIHGQVAHAFEIIGNFESGDNLANLF